jgi:Leucine-rich repeat (LRR) protein
MNFLSRWGSISVPILFLLVGCGSDSPKKLPEIIVTVPNTLPSIQTEEFLSVQFDKNISLVAEGSDADGEIISYLWSQTSGPEIELINFDKATASFQPKQALSEDTEYFFEIQVTDNEQGSITKSVKVHVKGLLSIIQNEILKTRIIHKQEAEGWFYTQDIKEFSITDEHAGELGYLTSLESLNLYFSGSNLHIEYPENLANLHSVTVGYYDYTEDNEGNRYYNKMDSPFDINTLSRLPNLLEMTLFNMRLDEVHSASTFGSITSLNLVDVILTDSNAALFTNYPQLKKLRASSNDGSTTEFGTIDFSAMPNLIEVYLPGIKIKNVSRLDKLSELESLTLNTHLLNDINLEGLNKLKYLELDCYSCIGLDTFHYNTLYKFQGSLEFVFGIENLTELQELKINNNIIKSLDLSLLFQLHTVNLSRNSLQEFTLPFDNELTTVNLNFNKLTNPIFMNQLDSDVQFTATRNFFLCYNLEILETKVDVSSIDCISTISNFDPLKVKDNYLLSCLYPFIQDEMNESIVSLTCGVGLGSAGTTEYSISSLEGIGQFSNLTDFKIDNDSIMSKIISLEPLAEILTLTRLSIDSNKITDISPLQGLQSLETIQLWYVEDVDVDVFLGWNANHPINCISMKLTEDDKQILIDHFSELTIEDYGCYFE